MRNEYFIILTSRQETERTLKRTGKNKYVTRIVIKTFKFYLNYSLFKYLRLRIFFMKVKIL